MIIDTDDYTESVGRILACVADMAHSHCELHRVRAVLLEAHPEVGECYDAIDVVLRKLLIPQNVETPA